MIQAAPMKENYFLHKLHSLTGIVPVGYYLVQHLTLNTFSLGGAEKFNGVIQFFEGMPYHFLLGLKIFGIWLPLIFHAVYGFFITSKGSLDLATSTYGKWFGHRYYNFQRISGILAAAFLVYHMTTTSVYAQLRGPEETIYYQNWAGHLASYGYLIMAFYMLGVFVSAFHFSFGIWSFCIRWGIAISQRAQSSVAKLSVVSFVLLTILGWAALLGFFYPVFESDHGSYEQVEVSANTSQSVATAR